MDWKKTWALFEPMLRAALAGIGVTADELKADTFDDDGSSDLPGLIHDASALSICMCMNGGEPHLLAQGWKTIRGCRTLPNGDPGYPDDVDVFDVQTWPLDQWHKAAAEFAALVAKTSIDNALEIYAESSFADAPDDEPG